MSTEPDWAVVEAAVASAVREYALAYWIPANRLCGGVRAYESKMASNWAECASPFITARIREQLRKATARGDAPSGGPICVCDDAPACAEDRDCPVDLGEDQP